jgi:hypothetical protein
LGDFLDLAVFFFGGVASFFETDFFLVALGLGVASDSSPGFGEASGVSLGFGFGVSFS